MNMDCIALSKDYLSSSWVSLEMQNITGTRLDTYVGNCRVHQVQMWNYVLDQKASPLERASSKQTRQYDAIVVSSELQKDF